jgi:hypothetical protein
MGDTLDAAPRSGLARPDLLTKPGLILRADGQRIVRLEPKPASPSDAAERRNSRPSVVQLGLEPRAGFHVSHRALRRHAPLLGGLLD